MPLTFKRAGTFDFVVSETGAVCSNGGGPSVIFGGKFVLLGNSALGGVGVVFVDQDDLTRDCTFPERSILFSDFIITDPVVNPNGKDEGPFPFIPLKLFRLETVAETNAADCEHVDDGDEEDVLGTLELIAPPGRGPLWGSVFGSVYEH